MPETIAAPAASATPAATAPSAVSTTVATPTPADSSAASATTTPAASPVQPATPDPIPFDRHKAILETQRAETAKAQQAYEAYKREQETDPFGRFQQSFDRYANHPQYEQHLLRAAANLLRSRRGQQAPLTPEPQPDIPVFNEQGQQVNTTYSAKQLAQWHEWKAAQQEAKLAQRLRPLEERIQQQQAKEQAAEQKAELDRSALTTVAELRQDPRFVEHETEIKTVFAEHPEWGDNLYRAYVHVLNTKVLPGEQTKVLDHLKTQAQGSTITPGTPAVSSVPKFKNFAEAARYFEAHPAEAALMSNK